MTFNVQQYSKFCKKIEGFKNNSYISETKEFKLQVEFIRDETIERLQQLIPNKRFKRGLINPLGSLIKVITGNLDNEDAAHFDQLITEIKSREQANSQRITILSEMLDHIANTSKIMDENNKILNNKLNKLESLIKDISKKDSRDSIVSHMMNVFHLFIINFRTIFIKLSDIETSLALSKVSVLHKAILNSNELLHVLNEISKVDRLMYPVNEQNLVNLEETFNVKTYIKDNNVRFIINVPLVENVTYTYYKLYTLPISSDPTKDTVAIIPESPYLLVEGIRYRPIAHRCKEITAKEYLCLEDEVAVNLEESCIEQLMEYKQNHSKCLPQRVKPENLKIEKISQNSWILFSKYEKTLFQKCGDDVIQERLCGTYILTIQKPCDVFVDNMPIYGHRFHSLENSQYKKVPITSLPNLQEPEQNDLAADTEPIDIKGINLDDYQHLNYLLKKSAKSDISETQVKSFDIATIVLYIIIAVIVIFGTWFKFQKFILKRLCNVKQPNTENNVEINVGTRDRPILMH